MRGSSAQRRAERRSTLAMMLARERRAGPGGGKRRGSKTQKEKVRFSRHALTGRVDLDNLEAAVDLAALHCAAAAAAAPGGAAERKGVSDGIWGRGERKRTRKRRRKRKRCVGVLLTFAWDRSGAEQSVGRGEDRGKRIV